MDFWSTEKERKRTPQAETVGDCQASHDGVEHVLGAAIYVEEILDAEHGRAEHREFPADLEALLEPAERKVVVFALVVHVPARSAGGQAMGVLGTEAQAGHFAAVGEAQSHADAKGREGRER